jgi:transcription-repair coupling factor (superfamily II helicase)
MRPLAVFSAERARRGAPARGNRLVRAAAARLPAAGLETLPYDSFSPHHDLVSERLRRCTGIQRGDFDVVFVPAATGAVPALARLPTSPLQLLPAAGDASTPTACAASSRSPATTRVTQVVTPGEFCFPRRHRRPVSRWAARCPTAST